MRKKELQKRKERKTSKAEKGKSYLLEDQDAIAAGTMYVCVCVCVVHVVMYMYMYVHIFVWIYTCNH